ncbi:HNH endonuclease signature motif containing protein [Phycicoccus duodecadis]|uniref:Uncharacterized protein DUF222 n=1 Tax=Phycicoccus duodecadis TaxID=173053 RepID=A0A2N3YGE6_9MICO|nr:HNH endonuclease signature motif containing protein [Phycicoccus duodecadis]PKW25918.1 uncharacterized protein DUF222 [Phycicoccus duodecadis]
MTRGTIGIAERRSAIAAARAAIGSLGEVLATASAEDLAALMGELDAVVASASAARVEVVVEATRRGECTGSGVHAWVREHAPSLRQGGAAAVARVAQEVTARDTGLERRDPDGSSPVGIVWSAVRAGTLEAGTGCAVLREAARLEPLLRPEAAPTVTAALVDLAAAWGPAMMRRLRPRLVAEHGHHGAFDQLHDTLAAAARLSSPRIESGDLTEYQLWMTPEQAATLEAAIGPLSAPQPNGETGEKDRRPAGQRRVEALTTLCAASSARTADETGDPSTNGTVLHVSIDLTDLEHRTGAAEVLGSTADGTLLPPETLRRLACDAALVPYVLGTHGETLDVGRVARLFTRAQRRLLRKRDRGCTYPGCTAPPDWARAHHIRHWADGGPTDTTNAALLCDRHHTHVHQKRLWAHVRERPDRNGRHVTWDLTPGSYDHHLTLTNAAQPPPHPATQLLHALIGPLPPEPDDLDGFSDDDPWWDDTWPDDGRPELAWYDPEPAAPHDHAA